VGWADLVTGLFQFDSVDGVADDGDGLGAADGVCSAGETLGSGASVGTGAGAGAAGTGGAGGGGSITGADDVCVGDGVGVSLGPGFGLPGSQFRRHNACVGLLVSACPGAATERHTTRAITAAAAAAETSRSTDEDRIMVTFRQRAAPLPQRDSVSGSLLQRATGPQIHWIYRPVGCNGSAPVFRRQGNLQFAGLAAPHDVAAARNELRADPAQRRVEQAVPFDVTRVDEQGPGVRI